MSDPILCDACQRVISDSRAMFCLTQSPDNIVYPELPLTVCLCYLCAFPGLAVVASQFKLRQEGGLKPGDTFSIPGIGRDEPDDKKGAQRC